MICNFLQIIVAHVTKWHLSWYGHIRQRGPITRIVLDKGVPGKRLRGWSRIKWMDIIKRDMKTYDLDIYDGRQEGVVKDGGNGRHTLVYKTQCEKVITL